jgi:hypothetical protein
LNEEAVKKLLSDVASGDLPPEQALDRIRRLPFEDVGGFAKIDHHRGLRCGAPEVIFCEGKTPEQVRDIARSILDSGVNMLATRARPDHYTAVCEAIPDAEYDTVGRCITVEQEDVEPAGQVLVVTAGTSDLPVAHEAVTTARMLGAQTELLSDVGVAGLHRLLAHGDVLTRANVVVAVAGMEGALASVLGGLVSKPVIAVPTSIGYGASFNGVAPLLSMLNCCASGVAVVNIDNGFGGGYMAALINRMAVEPATAEDRPE